ncbi:MAG: ABC transporter ATP-binding protein [Clostridia bacterium]|nr:ABC transporter ATP-binding protein [Clostridia bacterium]
MDEDKKTAPINRHYIKRLLKYLMKYKKNVILTILCMFISSGCAMLSPFLLQQIIDIYIPDKNIRGLLFISFLLLASVIMAFVFNRIKMKLAGKTGQMAIRDIREDLFNHVEELSFKYYDKTSAGRIIVRIVNDVNQLSNLFTNSLINVITEFTMLILAVVIMFSLNYKLSMLTFAIIPAFMVVIFLIRNKIIATWREVSIKVASLNAYIHESILGMQVVQAYVRQRTNRAIFMNVIKDAYDSWIRAIKVNGVFGPAVYVISVVGTISIYWFGSRMLQLETITIGVLVAFTSYLGRFMQPVLVLSNVYNELLVAMSSCERIFEMMDYEIDIKDVEGAADLEDAKGDVEFKNVTFSYNEEKTVLKNVSFTIKKGSTVAIVGPTGSGKTTIINLLARFYDPVKGSIYVNGEDIHKVTIRSLRDKIGIMLQDPFIFSGTVLENLRYGNPKAAIEKVHEAARMIGVHDFIMEMENQYDTILNERGSRLSIGQKQLIAFTRVILSDPQLLILDEATSSVDTHTEKMLQDAILTVLKDRTSFVIAHRLSTIRNADVIMVIENGELAEMGSHNELIVKNGIYNNLYQAQYMFLKENS